MVSTDVINDSRYDKPACDILMRAAIYLCHQHPIGLRRMVGGYQAYRRPADVEEAVSLLYALRCIASFDREVKL